mmetsp:Transcript_29167/g.78916  ORF Transcript_29167/g.78916 Transcript_29167/m.78916 type:complete len:207 (-) Transcript_29167:1235-1855(-)
MSTLHGHLVVRSEGFPTHGNGHVPHAFQSSASQGKHFLFGQPHQFNHEVGYATNVWREFFLGRNGSGSQRRDSHFLNASLVRGFKHARQLLYQGIEQWADSIGFQSLTEHLQNIARCGLHGDGLVVQQIENDGKDFGGIIQHGWLAVLGNLTQAEAGTLPDLRIGILRAFEHMWHQFGQVLGNRFCATFCNHTQTRNTCLSVVGLR